MKNRRRKRPAPPLKAPEPYKSVIDSACAVDRAYFEAHPGEKSYVRPLVPGECWPLDPRANMVEVVKLGPGARVRRPFFLLDCTQMLVAERS